MSEYGISSRTKKYSFISISLVPLIVFCGFMALALASIFLFRAYNNYSAISNGIVINPSVVNMQMLSKEKQHLLLAVIEFIILLLFVFLPALFIGIYTTVIQIIHIRTSKIIIESENIKWLFPGGELVTNWTNLKSIIKRNKIMPSLVEQICIELKEPQKPIYKNPLFKILGGKVRVIPIFIFFDNWDSDLGKIIIQRAPWLLQ
jgi:hypothetical protein